MDNQDNPQPGPSGLNQRPRSRIFDTTRVIRHLENSDSEDDDFDVADIHLSDDSGSSSEDDFDSWDPIEEDEDDLRDLLAEDKYGYSKIRKGTEDLRLRDDPTFLGRKKSNVPTDHITEPVDFFQIFFDEELLTDMVRETNRYAAQLLAKDEVKDWIRDHPSSRLLYWPENGITLDLLKKYLGLLLNMGLTIKAGPIADYWTTRPSQKTPYFSHVMSANVFLIIHRMLHLNDSSKEKKRGEDGFDPWIKVRLVLDKVNKMSKLHYSPSQHVSIDESMVGMKNRSVYLQYMPNKRHARFGIKKFQLCDDNGYVMHIDIYAGKDIEMHGDDGDGQAVRVVKRLLKESRLLNKGYRVYTDNFYTKPRLADDLLKQKTILTGTVRHNSKKVPEQAKKKLAVGDHISWRRGELLLTLYREKKSQTKPVLVLSTGHNATTDYVVKRGKVIDKPQMILDYNKHMGGVDISDKMVCHYASERSTRRYWKKIFQNLMDISVLNSWILHSETYPAKKISRRQFLIEVIEAFCETTVTTAILQHHLILLDGKKEKDCVVCSVRGSTRADKNSSRGRKRSRHWCPACKVGCHERCEPNLVHQTDRGLKMKRKA